MVSAAVSELVPSNATPYERAMAAALDARERLRVDLKRLPAIGISDIPEDWVAWLIVHYALEAIYPVVGDGRRTLTEGRRWQRVRGTPAATEDYVLAWLGLSGLAIPDRSGKTGAIEEERHDDVHADWYQIGLAAPVAPREQRDLLIRGDTLSKDAGSRLGRIYAGYDVRPLRHDQTKWDDALWDDWSGVRLPGVDPVISFGLDHGGVVELEPAIVGVGHTSDLGAAAHFEGGFIWDQSRLDAEVIDVAIVRVSTGYEQDRDGHATRAGGSMWPARVWPGIAWTEFNFDAVGGPI